MRISDWSSDVCSSDLRTDMFARNQFWQIAALLRVGAPAADLVDAEIGVGAIAEADRSRSARNFLHHDDKIGRESCRERVCQYVEISVVDGSLKKKRFKNIGKNEVQRILYKKQY